MVLLVSRYCTHVRVVCRLVLLYTTMQIDNSIAEVAFDGKNGLTMAGSINNQFV